MIARDMIQSSPFIVVSPRGNGSACLVAEGIRGQLSLPGAPLRQRHVFEHFGNGEEPIVHSRVSAKVHRRFSWRDRCARRPLSIRILGTKKNDIRGPLIIANGVSR
jgi:hypothetical protein